MSPEGWSALFAGAATSVAAYQVWSGRADARRQAAFTHIREVEARLQRVWHISVKDARRDILSFYQGEAESLSDRGADYMAYLSALDLLLFASQTKSAEPAVIATWLRGTLRRDDELLQFVSDMQQACGDPSCYEYVWQHLNRVRRAGVSRTQ